MKKYTVIVEFKTGRKNQLVEWCENEEQAKKLALKDWQINADMAKNITVKEG